MAAGKRLAAHNRMVREAKKKAEAEAASAAALPSGNTPSGGNNIPAQAGANSISLMTMLGIGGLIVSAAGVYYQREAIMKSFKSTPQAATPPEPATTPPAPTPAPSRIPVKRGLRKME